MSQITLDLWEDVFAFLEVTDFAHAAASSSGDLKTAASHAKLRWALRKERALGNRWLLSFDSAKAEEEESTSDEDLFTGPFTKPTRHQRRMAKEGDMGLLGWYCCWADDGTSLWLHALKAGSNQNRMVPIDHSSFLAPVAQRASIGRVPPLRGKWLEMQVLCLLGVWKPPQVGDTDIHAFVQPPWSDVARELRDSCCRSYQQVSVQASTHCAQFVRRFIMYLQPKSDVPDMIFESERISVQDGNLLSIVAVSSLSVGKLLEPLSLLVNAGAMVSHGNHILAALRKQESDLTLYGRWKHLWEVVAARSLSRCFDRLVQFAQLRRRPSLLWHRVKETHSLYPQPYRTASYSEVFSADIPVARDLQEAIVVSLAAGQEAAATRDVLQEFANDVPRLRRIFWDAIVDECRMSNQLHRVPKQEWLESWLQAGSAGTDHSWLVPGEFGLDEKSPLQIIGHSEMDAVELVDIVCLLTRFGDWGGFEDNDDEDVVEVAMRRTPSSEPARSLWISAWKLAAEERLKWMSKNWYDYDEDLLAQSLKVALAVGIQGPVVETAGLLLNESEKERRYHFKVIMDRPREAWWPEQWLFDSEFCEYGSLDGVDASESMSSAEMSDDSFGVESEYDM